jgi:hypothetical protein
VSPNALKELLGFLPCALWFVGAWLTGNKRTYGWAILFFSEFGWMALGVVTHIWTLVFWSLVGLGTYARNFYKWRRESKE